MIKFMFYVTLAAAIAGTACGKKEEYPKQDDSWGINTCVMKEQFQQCVVNISKATTVPKDSVEQCESAARVLSRAKNRFITPECKGY